MPQAGQDLGPGPPGKLARITYNGGLSCQPALNPQDSASPARVVKLVDAGDSKSPAARRAGSIPAPGTIFPPLGTMKLLINQGFSVA